MFLTEFLIKGYTKWHLDMNVFLKWIFVYGQFGSFYKNNEK